MFFSRAETCETVGFSLDYLKELLKAKVIREIRLGRRSLIPKSELENLAQKCLEDEHFVRDRVAQERERRKRERLEKTAS